MVCSYEFYCDVWGFNVSFKDISYKSHYDSIKDDVLNDFYVPTLKQTKKYQRTVAYFESKFLALAASGLKDFILNNGKMELVCGPKLTQSEIKSIQMGVNNPEEIISSNFLKDLDNLEDEIILNHVKVLGWMIANNLLKIKIAIKKDENGNLSNDAGILHYKIGVMQDENHNIVSYSGSINDTVNAWSRKNLEEFHVFKSWTSGDISHLKSNIDTFNNIWYNTDDSFDVISVPNAVEYKLIDIAPDNIEDLDFDNEIVDIVNNAPIDLYEYQKTARDNWVNSNFKGIFEMATGTGKTYTALACLDYLLNKKNKLVTIITAPYKHLLPQWKKSILKFPISTDGIIIADSTNNKWFDEIYELLVKMFLGNIINKIIILTTNDTYSNPKFINLLSDNKKFDYFLIADEMHGLGSTKYRKGLIETIYDYRLGLSATPVRFLDGETELLFNFFEDIVFKFSLEEAITTYDEDGNRYLTPFYYKPYSLSLNRDELKDYKDITEKLVKFDKNDDKYSKIVENLFFKRANIIKDAKDKIMVFNHILDDLDDISNLIIYCSDSQIDEICNTLSKRNIIFSKFTMDTGTKPLMEYGGLSERELVLEDFSSGIIQVLVAMHCLDEGVDVPSAKQAIFMCSSNSSREFIQRIGRVIRTYPNKKRARIYDLIVSPQLDDDDPLKFYEKRVFERERRRYEEIGRLAINTSEVNMFIDDKM